ncbi:MAG TPA: cyclic nucleotide-binding domain-containing protein [Candidatus Coatesbacteria bacterium]|nr:cyclic nucleotide-binding domain-containing protein [Candidatus Coatesbacteria bacterium]
MMDTNTLARIQLFADLAEEELEKILGLLHRLEVQPEQEIVVEGETGQRLYIIVEGTAQVRQVLDTDRSKVLATLGKGNFFGELALLDSGPRSASVVSVSPCELYYLDRDEFMELLRQHPEMALKLAQTLAGRLRRANRQIRDLSLYSL